MAIDYFLTLQQFGSATNEARVREFLMREFPLVGHTDTRILTEPGLSVNVFIDDDSGDADDSHDTSYRPNIVISFRISKREDHIPLGYQSMRRIVDRVVHSFDVDLRVSDELDQYIYLTKVAGKVIAKYRDHDFWKVGADVI